MRRMIRETTATAGKSIRVVIITGRIVLATVFVALPAQARDGVQISLGAGASLPTSPETFSDAWKTGYNLSGGIGYSMSPLISFSADVLYSDFAFDEQGALDAGLGIAFGDGNTTILSLLGRVDFSFLTDRRVSPYAKVGAGASKVEADTVPLVNSTGQQIGQVGNISEWAFSVVAGAGIDINVNRRVGIFVEGQYLFTATESQTTSYLPLTVGIRLRA